MELNIPFGRTRPYPKIKEHVYKHVIFHDIRATVRMKYAQVTNWNVGKTAYSFAVQARRPHLASRKRIRRYCTFLFEENAC